MNSITLHKDPKTHIITLLRGGKGKDTILELDSSGNIELTDEILKAKDIDIIDQYEYEIAEVLSEEQQTVLYRSWGSALSIMISRTANVVGIDKRLAKEIITQGERHGILYQGNNNTWKIKDSVTKTRWADKVKGIEKESKPEKDMTTEGILSRYAAKAKELGLPGFKKYEEEEEGMIVEEKYNENELQPGDHAEVIPEEPLVGMEQPISGIEMLKKRRTELKAIMLETNRNDIHDRRTELTNIETQIGNAERQSTSHRVGVPTKKGGCAVNITKPIEKMIHSEVKSTAKKALVPVKKVLAKGKPFKPTR